MPINVSALTAQQQATAIYVAYYDRAPDPAGLQFWTDQLQGGRPAATVASDFSTAAETQAEYPFFSAPDVASATTFITQVYANLFGRTPDTAGRDFWADALTSGAVPVGEIILAILEGAQDAASGGFPDSETITNKITVGLDWGVSAAEAGIGLANDPIAQEVNGQVVVNNPQAFNSAKTILNGVDGTAASVTAAQAATDSFIGGTSGGSGTGQTFTLTTAVGENVSGTDGTDTINGTVDAAGLSAAPAATFNTTDNVDGGAGVDTINISSTSAGAAPIPAGAVQNVEVVNLISDVPGNTFAATAGNAANYSGVQQLWQIGGTASQAVTGLTDAITAGFSNTVANNVVGATGLMTANVALNNVNTSTLLIDEAAGTTTSALTTINVNGSMTAAQTLTIDADTGGAGAAPTAETNVNLGLTVNATTVVLTSATTTTIDANTSTAGITMAATPAAVKTYIGGSGVDNITGGAAVTSMTGNGGNDVLNAVASTGSVSLDGGAGMDVLSAGVGGSKQDGGAGMDIMNGGAGVDTFIVDAGDSSLRFATIDQITAFTSGADKLDFNLTAGSAANFLADASSAGFVDSLSNANTAMDGTVQYFLATGIADVDPNTGGAQAGNLLFVDSDLNGTADFSVAIQGTTPVFGDIIA